MDRKLARSIPLIVLLLLLSFALTLPAAAGSRPTFPDLIPLPDGIQPEGIAVGRGSSFYVGSLATGAIYAGNLRTGAGAYLVPPQNGRTAVGLAVDLRTNYLFVAGGPFGSAYVYDLNTGASLAEFQLTTEPATFINDVVVTRNAAYLTDSFRPVYYRVPLGPGGSVPGPGAVEEIALGPEYDFEPFQFNANGIVATPDGRSLVIVNSFFGRLYLVEATTGATSPIDLGGGTVFSGDGLLLDGRTLFVVRNFFNEIAVVDLDPGLFSGTVLDPIIDSDFRIPTTVAEFGNRLYAVNARFDVAPPGIPAPDVEFEVVAVTKP